MANKWPKEQWLAYKGKFSWMKVHEEFSNIELQIVEKWIERHISGWFYFDISSKNTYLYVFENDVEMVAFKIWLADRPFDNEYGEVNEKQVL